MRYIRPSFVLAYQDDATGGGGTVAPPKKRPLVSPLLGQPTGLVNPPPMVAPPAPGVAPPPPNIAPPAPQVAPPAPQTTPIVPGQDLQARQIAPNQPPALKPFQQVAAPTSVKLPVFNQIGAPVSAAPSADTARARQLTAQGLEGLVGAPSRRELAEQEFESLGAIENAKLQQGIRSAGQRAAALGRLGSGMVDEETSDLFGAHKATLADIKRRLATDTAGQELSDRQSNLAAARGVAGEFAGEDRAQAGLEQGLREEGRGERGQSLDYARDILNREGDLRTEARGERAAGRQDELTGLDLERGYRDELRGERGYQTSRDDKATEDAITQRRLEEEILGSEFGRDVTRAGFDERAASDQLAQAGETEEGTAALIEELLRSGQGGNLPPELLRALGLG